MSLLKKETPVAANESLHAPATAGGGGSPLVKNCSPNLCIYDKAVRGERVPA